MSRCFALHGHASSIGAVRSNLAALRQEWDRLYRENCIFSTERKKKRKGKSTDE